LRKVARLFPSSTAALALRVESGRVGISHHPSPIRTIYNGYSADHCMSCTGHCTNHYGSHCSGAASAPGVHASLQRRRRPPDTPRPVDNWPGGGCVTASGRRLAGRAGGSRPRRRRPGHRPVLPRHPQQPGAVRRVVPRVPAAAPRHGRKTIGSRRFSLSRVSCLRDARRSHGSKARGTVRHMRCLSGSK
jgi:hypothetical protein